MNRSTPTSRSFFTAFREFVHGEAFHPSAQCLCSSSIRSLGRSRSAHTRSVQDVQVLAPERSVARRDPSGNQDVAKSTRRRAFLQNETHGQTLDAKTPFQHFLQSQKGRHTTPVRFPSADRYGIFSALRREDIHEVMLALGHAELDGDYLRTVPRSTWLEIVRLVAPPRGQAGIHRVHRSMNPRQLRQIGYLYKDDISRRTRWLRLLVAVTRHGSTMGIAEYRLLLEYTARTGSAKMAGVLWASLKRDGVQPDVACFNHYMEALVYDELKRVTQASRNMDSFPRQEHKFTRITLFKTGVSETISQLFREMASLDLPGDTTTFCAFMTALARDGDLDAVNNILKTVWGIDVKIMSDNEKSVELPMWYEPSSPLYPSTKLLATLATSYGSHNQIPLALRLVDTVAQQYNLPIKGNLYYQLIQWTWMQARYKHPAVTGRVRKPRKEVNQTKLATVSDLIDTMIADPEARVPSIETHHLGLRNTIGPFRSKRSFAPLEDAQALYIRAIGNHRSARGAYLRASRGLAGVAKRSALARLRLRMEETERAKRKHQTFLLRFVRIVLTQYVPRTWVTDGKKRNQMDVWTTRGLPSFIAKWKTFVPSVVTYRTASGRVHLQVRGAAEISSNTQRAHAVSLRVKKFAWLSKEQFMLRKAKRSTALRAYDRFGDDLLRIETEMY